MILLIDNFDSFVYNLFQEFKIYSDDVIVKRRNSLTLQDVIEMSPQMIVISPGPGRPEDADLCNKIIKIFSGNIPILGVCLGHQCIAHTFGGKVIRANRVMQGITSEIYHDGKTIFCDLPNPFEATRYNSLIVSDDNLPDELEVSAYTTEGEIMGIRVRGTLTEGIQFHPESFLTTAGKKLIRNFIEMGKKI